MRPTGEFSSLQIVQKLLQQKQFTGMNPLLSWRGLTSSFMKDTAGTTNEIAKNARIHNLANVVHRPTAPQILEPIPVRRTPVLSQSDKAVTQHWKSTNASKE